MSEAMQNDSDKVLAEIAGTLFFDSHGCGPVEDAVKVRSMVACGEPRVGLMGDAVGGWFLLPAHAREIARALLAAAHEVELAAGALMAWCNSYEVIAAHSADEAREVLRSLKLYDEDELDGDGWEPLNGDELVRDEAGKPTGRRVEDEVRALGKPGPLWSCEV